MTNTVKGAGRNAAAARRKKQERAEQRLAELKHDEETGARPTLRGKVRPGQPVAKPKPINPGDEVVMHAKVKTFSNLAENAGWTVAYESKEDGEHLTCTRDDETLTIFWLNGVYQQWAQYWKGDGPKQRVQNAKSGQRLLERNAADAASANTKKALAKKRATPRSARSTTSTGEPLEENLTPAERTDIILASRGTLPFDEESTDEEIVAAVAGRAVTWVNRLTGKETTARVPRTSDKTKVEEGRGGRGLHFCSTEGPFVAMYLDSITRVS